MRFTITLIAANLFGVAYSAALNMMYRRVPSTPSIPGLGGLGMLGLESLLSPQPGTGHRSSSGTLSNIGLLRRKRSPTPAEPANAAPTPEPTGVPSGSKTVHITDQTNFSLIAPKDSTELVSDAENDGETFCSPGASGDDQVDCSNRLPEGSITAAAVYTSPDNAFTQITGCLDSAKFGLSPDDQGGQFDVRYPNGAFCTFGGYAASFIEILEPEAQRFCLRCCASANDQVNCNSHQDRSGCSVAIPGQYDFPEVGVSCA